MQFSKNTSTGIGKGFLIKMTLAIFNYYYRCSSIVNKIDFPSPNKEIEKIIPNEKLKIVK